MPRFDRYLLSQLLTLFGFFALVLVMVYWIRAAVALFDKLISDGQSARVVLELTAMSLPGVIQIVLPLAAFAAAVYATNRLTSDSELVVMQATGFSPYRLVRPALYFGLISTFLTMIVAHFLVPEAAYASLLRRDEINQNVTARILVEGKFQSPSDDLTVYIRDITRSGELLDLFLSDTRAKDSEAIYTASRSYLVRGEYGPQLVMIDGQAQTLDTTTGNLVVTSFDDFVYDLGGLITPSTLGNRSPRQIDSLSLLRASPELQAETGKTAGELAVEAHSRNANALLALVGAVMGTAALLVGGFSRFGVWRQVMLAVALVIVVKLVESVAANALRTSPEAWYIPYAPIVTGLLFTYVLLFIADHPMLFKRRRQEVSA